MHQDNYNKHEGIRRSDLWHMNRSPAYFKAQSESKSEPTASMIFGIAVHKMVLEPDTFFDEYAIAPDVDKRTKDGKEKWQNFLIDCQQNNKSAISICDFNKIKAMVKAIENNPLATMFLTGQHETEWYWEDIITKEKVKAKCDNIAIIDNKKIIVDYKTTSSCQDGYFESSINKYGYQFQAGFYTAGLEQITNETYGFAFVAQETVEPYDCRVYVCSEAFIANGQLKYRELLNLYHECKINNNWYGYNGAIQKPTLLMDISEYKANKNQSFSGFNSDDYLDETDY